MVVEIVEFLLGKLASHVVRIGHHVLEQSVIVHLLIELIDHHLWLLSLVLDLSLGLGLGLRSLVGLIWLLSDVLDELVGLGGARLLQLSSVEDLLVGLGLLSLIRLGLWLLILHCLHLMMHSLIQLAECGRLSCHLIRLEACCVRLLGDSRCVLSSLHLDSLRLLHVVRLHLVQILWLRHLSLWLLLDLGLSSNDLPGGPRISSELALCILCLDLLLLISRSSRCLHQVHLASCRVLSNLLCRGIGLGLVPLDLGGSVSCCVSVFSACVGNLGCETRLGAWLLGYCRLRICCHLTARCSPTSPLTTCSLLFLLHPLQLLHLFSLDPSLCIFELASLFLLIFDDAVFDVVF